MDSSLVSASGKNLTTRCRLCKTGSCKILFDFKLQPNVLSLLESSDSSCIKHSLVLHHCTNCNFVFIANPMPDSDFYEDVQHATSYSPALHMPELIQDILGKLSHIANPFVYEIGCNDGYFLKLLRDEGLLHVAGVDPADKCASIAREKGIKVSTDYFSKDLANEVLSNIGVPDMVICRQVLEHITDLDSFMLGLKAFTDSGSILLLESPDLGIRNPARNIWEQHVNYFDLATLANLLDRFDIGIFESSSLAVQYDSWLAFCRKGKGQQYLVEDVDRSTLYDRVLLTLNTIAEEVKALHDAGMRIAAFGAGARGTILINLSNIGQYLEFVVDENPYKVGKFLPGCRVPIVPLSHLAENVPDVLLLLPLGDKGAEFRVMNRLSEFRKKGMSIIELTTEDGEELVIHPPEKK